MHNYHQDKPKSSSCHRPLVVFLALYRCTCQLDSELKTIDKTSAGWEYTRFHLRLRFTVLNLMSWINRIIQLREKHVALRRIIRHDRSRSKYRLGSIMNGCIGPQFAGDIHSVTELRYYVGISPKISIRPWRMSTETDFPKGCNMDGSRSSSMGQGEGAVPLASFFWLIFAVSFLLHMSTPQYNLSMLIWHRRRFVLDRCHDIWGCMQAWFTIHQVFCSSECFRCISSALL
jgi:hypothetical protein